MVCATLAACQEPPGRIPALDTERTARDELPPDVVDGAEYIDASSSRLLGVDDDVSYFVAIGHDDETAESGQCLVIYAGADAWVAGCSRRLPVSLHARGLGTARLVEYHVDKSDDNRDITWIGDHLEVILVKG